MKKGFVTTLIIIIVSLFCFTGCVKMPATAEYEKPQSVAEAAAAEVVEEVDQIVTDYLAGEQEEVLALFDSIESNVRASGNLSAIQAFLTAWAQSNNLVVEQDEAGNIIVDKAADAGYENYPKVILQAHMDYMDYSGQPVETFAVPQVTNDNGVMTGSASFGASDGIGMALIMQMLISDNCQSGPLRAVFTADGDFSQYGASALDSAKLDADYLVSFDGVNTYSLGYGNTGSRAYSFTREYSLEKNKTDSCYVISVSGLVGGDSGLYIDTGRANAVRLVAECVEQVINAGVEVSVADFAGGGDFQTFPVNAYATVCIDSDDEEKLNAAVNTYIESVKAMYGNVETGMAFDCVKQENNPEKVLSQADSSGLLNFLTLSVEGVNTLSAQEEGLVESSCSIYSVSMADGLLSINKYARGYSSDRFDQMENADTTLCSMCGFAMNMISEIPGWSTDASGVLLNKAVNIFSEYAGDKINASMLNTTMETGFFAEKKPGIDMIIIGADINNVHSNTEQCNTESLQDLIYLAYSLVQEVGV